MAKSIRQGLLPFASVIDSEMGRSKQFRSMGCKERFLLGKSVCALMEFKKRSPVYPFLPQE
jgi:hypothetical protein